MKYEKPVVEVVKFDSVGFMTASSSVGPTTYSSDQAAMHAAMTAMGWTLSDGVSVTPQGNGTYIAFCAAVKASDGKYHVNEWCTKF